MPQPKKGARLGSGPAHQRQMLSNLALSLFEHERIKTTEAKAKMLRPFAERLITKAKKGDVHHRRQVLSVIEDRSIVHKLFDDIGPRFADRNGGYTRIMKLGPRNGDGAPMALIELVDEGGLATTVGEDEGEGRKRRRISRPRRRTPQDKPVVSRAAEAAAAGSGDDADVEAPPHVEDEEAEARSDAEETRAEATDEAGLDEQASDMEPKAKAPEEGRD